MSSVVRAENENIIKKLYEEKAQLTAKAVESDKRIAKLKEVNEKLRKNEKSLKRKGGVPSSMSHRGSNKETQPAAESETNSAKLMELTSRLGLRLENAEKQLATVREENRKLKQTSVNAGGALRDASDVAMAAAGGSFEQRDEKEWRGGDGDIESLSKLQREVQDLRAKLRLLQTRYDHLEAKARAQTELQQGSYDQLEEYNRRIRELRRALQDVQLEKSSADARASRAGELELEVSELRSQNEKFESTIKKLCESPFISSAYDQEERAVKIQEFEQNFKGQQLKMEHLQETAHNHHAALVAMKQQCEALKFDKENAENELEELRNLHSDSKQQAQLLKDKMRLYSGDDDMDMDQLEQALTIVKRRAGGPDLDHLNLEVVDDALNGDVDQEVTTLKVKVKDLYKANQTLQFDVERSESMLKAQLAINRELHLELERLEQGKGASHKEQAETIQVLEGECAKLRGNIRTLEIERKQRLYDIRRGRNNNSGKEMGSLIERDGEEDDQGGDEDTLLEELEPGEELASDENLVEVWVRGAELADNVWEADAPSFAIIDFFNFESEATPVLDGKSPRFDFASSYKVVVDDFLLKFLATQPLIIEICRVRGVDFELIGRCSIALNRLLTSRPSIKLSNEPLLSSKDGSVVGTVNLEIRMGKVVDELYQLFLNNHPEERLKIESSIGERMNNEMGSSTDIINFETNKLHNELEVFIHSAKGLPFREGTSDKLPTCFVHFQLLHFPDSFTRAVTECRAPQFEHLERFPLPTNPQMLALLQNGNKVGSDHRGAGTVVEFTVLDDMGDNEANSIGTCSVSLRSLSEGDPVHALLPLKNESERVVGELNLVVRWRHAFRTEKELGPHALGPSDLQLLTSMFSPEKDGLVDWKLFLSWSEPSPKLSHVAAVLRSHDERRRLMETFHGTLLEGSNDKIGQTDFIEGVFKYIQVTNTSEADSGDLSDEVSREELECVFKAFDRDGLVSRALLLFVLQPRSHVRVSLEDKCRAKSKHIKSMGVDLNSAFTSVDVGGLGRCSRQDFRSCLRNHMGFQLLGAGDEQAHQSNLDDSTLFDDMSNRPQAANEFISRIEDNAKVFDREIQTRMQFDQTRREREQELGLVGSLRDDDHDTTESSILLEANMMGTNRGATMQFENSSMSHIEVNDSKRDMLDDGNDIDEQLLIACRAVLTCVETEAFLRMVEAMDSTRSGMVDWVGIQKALIAAGWGNINGDIIQEACLSFGDVEHIAYHDFAITLLPKPNSSQSRPNRKVESAENDQGEIDRSTVINYGDVGMPVGDSGPLSVCISICSTEELLFKALSEVEGHRKRPDLRPEFEKLDTSGKAIVTKKQFLHVVGRYFGDVLDSALLRSNLLDFFVAIDKHSVVDSEGNVDYRAFLKFLDYKSPDVSAGVRAVEHMLLHKGSADAFLALDPRGLGVVSMEDFTAAVEELGADTHDGRSLPLAEVAALFRSGHGGVDWRAFLEYATEHGVSMRVSEAEKEACSQLNEARAQGKIKNIRTSMRVADPAGRGVVSVEAFEHSLQLIGVHLAAPLVKALTRRFSSQGGVDYNGFAMMVEAGPSMTTLNFSDDVDVPLTDSEREALRLRASYAVDEVFNRFGEKEAGPILLSCYKHYDFRGLGVVGMSEFVTASLRAGFALTRGELSALARGFQACDNFDNKLNICVSSNNAVHYQRFLGWVTPGSASNELDKTNTEAKETEEVLKEIRQRLQIVRREEDIFGRFQDADVRGTGFVDGRALDGCLASLPISIHEAAHLRKFFDVNRDGSFNHIEFSRFVDAGQPDLMDRRPSFESRLKELLLKCIKRGVDYRALFDQQDKEGSGIMSRNEFRLVCLYVCVLKYFLYDFNLWFHFHILRY